MYIQNRRDSSKFKGCSPLQNCIGLIKLKPVIAYFAYTYRYSPLKGENRYIHSTDKDKNENSSIHNIATFYWSNSFKRPKNGIYK